MEGDAAERLLFVVFAPYTETAKVNWVSVDAILSSSLYFSNTVKMHSGVSLPNPRKRFAYFCHNRPAAFILDPSST